MAIFWRTKIILAKIEVTYGTDPTPVAADGVLAKDVTLSPMEGSEFDRDVENSFFGSTGTLPVELASKLTFKVELSGSGTKGTPPQFGPLLRACGCGQTIVAATSVTYAKISPVFDSITLYIWIGGTQYVMKGARGDCTIVYEAQKLPYLMFEFKGLFVSPTQVTPVVPTLTGWKDGEVVGSLKTPTFTINAVPLVMRKAELKFGNQVEGRFLVGSESIQITDAKDMFSCQVEAENMGVINPFNLALNRTLVPISLVHGTINGFRSTMTIPLAQMQRVAGLEAVQNILEWPLTAVPTINAGNDQWTLRLT